MKCEIIIVGLFEVVFVISFLFPIIVVLLVAKISNRGRIIIIIFPNILFHHQFHPGLCKLDVFYTPSKPQVPKTLPVLSTREQHVTFTMNCDYDFNTWAS